MPAASGKADDCLARIKEGVDRTGLPLSAIEFNAGVSRKRLRKYLDCSGALRPAEIGKLVKFFRLDNDDPYDAGQFAVNQMMLQAVGNDVMGHSIAYIVKKGKEEEVASGTFVSIGKREFIATAAHTVPKLQSVAIKLVGYNTGVKPVDIQIVARGRKTGCDPDVGYIEVAPGTAKKLRRTPIGVDRVCDAGIGQPGRTAFLYGFPTELAKRIVNRKRRETVFGLRSFTYPNTTLPVDEWPEVPSSSAPPRKSVDVFLPYDTTAEMIVDPAVKTNRLPDPKGASGGGIWQSTLDKDGLWSTEGLKLIAIQSGSYSRGKYVRGVQIKHLLRLIRSDYSDLADSLDDVAKL